MLNNKVLNEFDKTLIIGNYFGFLPTYPPKIKKSDTELVSKCTNHPYYDAVEKMAVIRTYQEKHLASLPHPLAFIYKRPRLQGYALHLIGYTSAIAEATLIRTAFSILSEKGYKDLRVDINCVGDKESMCAYERELINYVRRLDTNLNNELKERIKEDIFNLFKLNDPEIISLRETAPPSITFLSSQSRLYFKEVLECLESLEIEFRLTPELVGDKYHSSHTIFAIRNADNQDALAVGYRYSRLSKLIGLRKEVPMISATIFSNNKSAGDRIYKTLPKPKFYLVQLGREAKIKTLSLIELLRSHRIPVYHLLGRDKITAQLSNAEDLKVSHLIIIGQKEALENTATVRNISTRAQNTINFCDLPSYLKSISP